MMMKRKGTWGKPITENFRYSYINSFLRSLDDEDNDNVRPITQNEAKNLAHYLKSKSLPGLSENERIHLIAMVDTIVEVRS